MKNKTNLSRVQINRKLKVLRKALGVSSVRPGWIRYMREALGMTLKQLAGRAGVSLPSVAQAERGEAAGKVTLATLRKMAHAMQCEFVYAFVPKEDLEEVMRHAALLKARRLLATADVHMSLEDQRVSVSMEERVKRLAETLLENRDVW